MRQRIDWDELNNIVDILSRSLLMSGEERLLTDNEIIKMNRSIARASRYAKNVSFLATLGKERSIEKLRIIT